MVHPHAAVLQRHADFRERVEPYFQSMFALARSIVKSDDLAWDAVQDALLRVWQLKILPDNPRGVLMRFVFPKSLELLRAQRRRAHYEQDTSALALEASGTEDPAVVVERDEEHATVQRHVNRLPQECREVISLRRDWGLDYAEIANKLNVPVGTVRSRLHRARLLLRARMNPVFRTDDARLRLPAHAPSTPRIGGGTCEPSG